MRSTSKGFLGPDSYRGRNPSVANSETSRVADRGLSPGRKRRLCELVYGFLIRQGAAGATDEEIALGLGIEGNSERPRRIQLESLGLVELTPEKRAARSGRLAGVYRALNGASLERLAAAERDGRQPHQSVTPSVPPSVTDSSDSSEEQLNFAEKAARFEFDANLLRAEAERRARIDVERCRKRDGVGRLGVMCKAVQGGQF